MEGQQTCHLEKKEKKHKNLKNNPYPQLKQYSRFFAHDCYKHTLLTT